MLPNISLPLLELIGPALAPGEPKNDGLDSAPDAAFPAILVAAESAMLPEAVDEAGPPAPDPETRPPVELAADPAFAALAALLVPITTPQTPPLPPSNGEAAAGVSAARTDPAGETPDAAPEIRAAASPTPDVIGNGADATPESNGARHIDVAAFSNVGAAPGDETITASATPEARTAAKTPKPNLDSTPERAEEPGAVRPEIHHEVKQAGAPAKPEMRGQTKQQPETPAARTAKNASDMPAVDTASSRPSTGPEAARASAMSFTDASAPASTVVKAPLSGSEQPRLGHKVVEKNAGRLTVDEGEAPSLAGASASPSVIENTAAPAQQAEAAPAAHLPEPLRTVMMAVRGAVARGEHEVRLHLQPESLGRVEARLNYSGGEVRVHLSADSPQTSALLQRHVSDLQDALAGAGVAVGQMSVTVGDGRAQSRLPLFERGDSASRREADPPALPGAAAVVKTSKVDYRV